MLENVKERLASFDYQVTEADSWILTFLIQKVENHIKNICNLSMIPEELLNIAVDMVVGEFLFNKKSTGNLAGFNLEIAIKQIQEGDTSITYAIGEGDLTPEKRLDLLIDYLMNRGKNELLSYRCIKW
jgi:hypothetical protein